MPDVSKKQCLKGAPNTQISALLLALALACALQLQTALATGDNAVIGWDGDKNGVIEHLNGSYRIRRDEGDNAARPRVKTYDISFGIYDNNPSPPVYPSTPLPPYHPSFGITKRALRIATPELVAIFPVWLRGLNGRRSNVPSGFLNFGNEIFVRRGNGMTGLSSFTPESQYSITVLPRRR